jgi:hypothetical protein
VSDSFSLEEFAGPAVKKPESAPKKNDPGTSFTLEEAVPQPKPPSYLDDLLREGGEGLSEMGGAFSKTVKDPSRLFTMAPAAELVGGALQTATSPIQAGLVQGARPVAGEIKKTGFKSPEFLKALGLDPSDPEGLANITGLAIPVGDAARAEVEFSKFAEKFPGMSRAALRPLYDAAKAQRAKTEAMAKAQSVAERAKAQVPRVAAAKVANLQQSGVKLQPWHQKNESLPFGWETTGLQGRAYREKVRETIESFNRAAYDKALSFIGLKTPEGYPVGNDGYAGVLSKVQAALNDAYRDATLTSNRATQKIINDAKAGIAGMDRKELKMIKNFVKDIVDPMMTLTKDRPLTGEETEKMISKIKKRASYHWGRGENDLGELYDDLFHGLVEQVMHQSPPHVAVKVQRANAAYAHTLTVERAVVAATKDNRGVFNPEEFISAIESRDPSMYQRKFATGRAPMQDFAQDAMDVLEHKLPALESQKGYKAGVVGHSIGRIGGYLVPRFFGIHVPFGEAMAGGAIGSRLADPAERAIRGYTNVSRGRAIEKESQKLAGVPRSIKERKPLTPRVMGATGGSRVLNQVLSRPTPQEDSDGRSSD